MNKVLVDRELLRRAADVLGSQPFSAWDEIAEQLRAFIAQAVEAERAVPVVAYRSSETGELYDQGYGLASPLALVLQEDHLAAMYSVIADRTKLCAAISDPEAVFVNMKRGTIAKPSLRSMIDLYGEVVNGDEAQLLEIARLRAEVEALRPDADRYLWLRDEAPWLESVPQVIQWCSDGSPQEIISDDELDAAIDAAMAAAANSHG